MLIERMSQCHRDHWSNSFSLPIKIIPKNCTYYVNCHKYLYSYCNISISKLRYIEVWLVTYFASSDNSEPDNSSASNSLWISFTMSSTWLFTSRSTVPLDIFFGGRLSTWSKIAFACSFCREDVMIVLATNRLWMRLDKSGWRHLLWLQSRPSLRCCSLGSA